MIEIKVPSPGESITQVQLARWLVTDGDTVEKDQEIAEIDSDKATLAVSAEEEGQIKLLVSEGDTVNVGAVIATIDTNVKGEKKTKETSSKIQGVVSVKEESNGEIKPVKAIEKVITTAIETELNISPLAKKLMQQKQCFRNRVSQFP
jgi:2-oxoglutarate dehydrogenase E2 component (dihydrolipoamide succinyltransferase)